MPLTLTPPVYGASRDGLVARYSTQFSGDNQIVLPLEGTFQGDPVKPVSLLIDNYDNGVPVAYTVGGDSDYIAAYTSQTIDVSGMHTALLKASSPVSIALAIYDRVTNINRSRGVAPSGASDPLWSNVLGLWHFDGPNGYNIAIDSKNPGLYIGPSTNGFISTAQSLFGGSSLHNTSTIPETNWNEQFAPANSLRGNYTFEFSIYAINAPVAANSCVVVGLGENISTNSNVTFAIEDDGSGTKFRIAAYRQFNAGGSTLLYATPYNLTYGAWVNVGFTTLGNFTMYINGVFSGVSPYTYNNLYGNIFFNTVPAGEYYFDECRLTLATRYTNNYTPATAPFPNQ